MSTPSLERVQQDLDVIKSALPNDYPYDRGSAALSALAGLCGVPLALRAVPGWEVPMRWLLLTIVACLMLTYSAWMRRARVERGVRPRRWSWSRDEAVASAIAFLGLIAYLVATRSSVSDQEWTFATWRGRLVAPVLFAFGVGLVSLGVVRSERWSLLCWGLPLTAVALGLPWIHSREMAWVAVGVAVVLGGLVGAVVTWRQVRNWEIEHARD